jgi:probable HAF family extracellular repeat protein
MKTLQLIIGAAATILLTPAAYPAGIPVYGFIWDSTNSMQSIGSFGGDSYAAGINDSGQVCGVSYYTDGRQRAFIWTEAGGMVDLGVPSGGTSSVGNAINAAGNVVGSAVDASQNLVATYWTQADGMIAIGRGQAWAINDRNEVTGQYSLPDGTKHAFFWRPGLNAPRDLGTLSNGWSTFGRAINNQHHITGVAYDDLGSGQIFIWKSKSGGIHLLPNGDNYSYADAFDINDSDAIVGNVFFGTHNTGVYVSPSGRTAFLPNLGGPDSYAAAINETGTIVGAADMPIGNQHAALWTAPTSPAQDLGALNNNSNDSSAATGINNLGQVVGWSQD